MNIVALNLAIKKMLRHLFSLFFTHQIQFSGNQTRIFLFAVFGSLVLFAVILWVFLFLTDKSDEGKWSYFCAKIPTVDQPNL